MNKEQQTALPILDVKKAIQMVILPKINKVYKEELSKSANRGEYALVANSQALETAKICVKEEVFGITGPSMLPLIRDTARMGTCDSDLKGKFNAEVAGNKILESMSEQELQGYIMFNEQLVALAKNVLENKKGVNKSGGIE